MNKLKELITSESWSKSLLLGAILAIILIALTFITDSKPFYAILLVSLLSILREDHNSVKTGIFNWRNLLMLILPVLAIYIIAGL